MVIEYIALCDQQIKKANGSYTNEQHNDLIWFSLLDKYESQVSQRLEAVSKIKAGP